jgi:hypothetical protein
MQTSIDPDVVAFVTSHRVEPWPTRVSLRWGLRGRCCLPQPSVAPILARQPTQEPAPLHARSAHTVDDGFTRCE